MLRADPARPGASRMVHSAGATPAPSVAAASSPGNNARKDRAVTSGKRNKQIVPYDPTIAGKANENRGNVSWEWSRQMLQSAASSRTRGKGGQPSAVRDEGKDTGFYLGSAPRRVKTYSC